MEMSSAVQRRAANVEEAVVRAVANWRPSQTPKLTTGLVFWVRIFATYSCKVGALHQHARFLGAGTLLRTLRHVARHNHARHGENVSHSHGAGA